MDIFPILLSIHVATVVLWIGGVAFVTTIIIPTIRGMEDSLAKALIFQKIESRFAKQAWYFIVVTGVSGGGLLYLTGRFNTLFTREGIGITSMVIVWFLYLMVLSFEKKIFSLLFGGAKELNPDKIFFIIGTFHWVVLFFSLLALFLGVFYGHS